MLVKLIFGQVADHKTNRTAEVAHFGGLEKVMETELEAPKNKCRSQTHDCVEGEGLSIVGEVARPEAENIALIKKVLNCQSDTCAH